MATRLPQVLAFASSLAACGGAREPISIDGSSTVFPISEAVAEEFRRVHPGSVAIGQSGTGGGFKRLCAAEIDIAGASRPIKPEEIADCDAAGVRTIELPVAYDGIAILVHPEADWIDHITVDELARLWAPEAQGTVKLWSDVRPGWPDKEIHLFGAGLDSGTYDYFTQAIVGRRHASRGDYTSSEDDNVLVQGIARDRHALGFCGYGYYVENTARLKLVAVDDGNPDNGDGPIAPSPSTVVGGTYQPLSRPVFLYVDAAAATRSDIASFVDFYLDSAAALAQEVGYIPLSAEAYALTRRRFAARTTGSTFGARVPGTPLELLLKAG